MLLVLDNYDSFTFNLVHYLRPLVRHQMDVIRNDRISLEEVKKYDAVIISPGPGLPIDAGITHDLIRTYGREKKILGVCLGHQALAEAFGGELKNLDTVLHGQTCTSVLEYPDPLFHGVPQKFQTGHYHSWTVKEPLPENFVVTARSVEGEVMAMTHLHHNLRGVQFHPESILTPMGKKILENWVRLC